MWRSIDCSGMRYKCIRKYRKKIVISRIRFISKYTIKLSFDKTYTNCILFIFFGCYEKKIIFFFSTIALRTIRAVFDKDVGFLLSDFPSWIFFFVLTKSFFLLLIFQIFHRDSYRSHLGIILRLYYEQHRTSWILNT